MDIALETPISSQRRALDERARATFLPDELSFEQRLATLSQSHLEILALTAQGYLNKQIAWMRGSAEGTIKSHQQEILRRLDLRSRTQAAVQFAVYCERQRNAELGRFCGRAIPLHDIPD